MKKSLKQALEFSNFRMVLDTHRKNLELFFTNKLTLPYKGGFFKIDSGLIGLITSLIIAKKKEFIFIDSKNIPILIMDLNDFLNQILKKYQAALEQYYKSYMKLEEAKDIRKVTGWDEETN